MSALPVAVARRDIAAPARPGNLPQTAAKPTLRLVPAPRHRRGRLLYLGVCLALAVACVGAVLALKGAQDAGSFEKHELTTELATLRTRRTVVLEELTQRAAPEALAAAAADLGMIPGNEIAHLRLSDGAIIGEAKPATRESDDETVAVEDTWIDPAASGTAGDGTAGDGAADGGEGENP